MMAETVTPESNYAIITVESNYNADSWGNNSNFNFTTTDGKIYTCVLTNVTAGEIYFRIKRNNDKEWGPESATDDLVLTNEYQQAYESHSKAFLINTTSGKTTYTITWNNESNQIKYEASEAGGGTGGDDGGSGTPTTNPLTGRVYTQGYYLAGSFFNFSGNKVTYEDAVFKFQEQKNDADGNAVYMVEIPASLTAHAQVMRVDGFGKTQKVYGPGRVYDISKDCPKTDETTALLNLTGSEILEEGTNYWRIATRNVSATEYSDGMYKVFITVDKKTGEPSKWEFKHIGNTRVAFFISDAKNATAMPVYDRYKKEANQFSNKFFASVNLSTGHSYYVISNYVVGKNESDGYIAYTKTKYGTLSPNGDAVTCPTTNKLFLLGNGGYAFNTNHNEFSPNEGPMKPISTQQGSTIVEYNPSKCDNDKAKTDMHLGIRGEVIIKDTRTQLTSVSLVGDAIPGTVKDDGTWDYASTAADMTYDETEKCYKVTLETTVGDGEKKFRFVGNHTQGINWHEDSNTEASMMAKTPYDVVNGKGHAATPYDPNKVNYTQNGANSGADWGIIWNRPAGRWTVRLFFYTYSDGNDPVTDYYYTISENRELELRDFADVVYNSLNNKRNILLRGDYKYFRTWSSAKAWKISNDVDIFVVDGMTESTDGVKFSLKKINDNLNADLTNTYNVIPANTGVILATKKTAANIEGGAVVHERASLTSYNTMVLPMEEYSPTTATTSTDYKGDNLLKPLIAAQVVPTKEVKEGETYYNYLFGFYQANKGLGVTSYKDNEFLLGFWISKGTGAFYNNSACLPIDKATAAEIKLGVSYNDFNPTTGAKKVPALFFDFANADDTTGIDEVVNTTVKNNDGKYYTLSGLQVEKPTAGGVYIHNGKKFVVR